jgi:isocitrate lyase
MNMRKKMRTLLKDKDYLITPGITNAMEAMIVEKVGFDFVYTGGYAASLALLGLPDVGLITETEMVTHARNIAKAVNIPVLVDADTGYGNAINVIRTVQDFEAAGVAGIHIEDQITPKRCGHVAGKMLIPIEEAVGKIRAAVDTRKDKDFIIDARTDAFTAVDGGFDEAVKRGKEYVRAGADMIFCEFPSPDLNIEHAKKFAEEMHKDFPNLPLHFNYAASFKWHRKPVKFSVLAEMGYTVIHVSGVGRRTSMQALWDYAVDLMEREEQAEIDFEKRLIGHPTEDFHKFSGFPKFKELEAKYLPGEEVQKKYEKSTGYLR